MQEELIIRLPPEISDGATQTKEFPSDRKYLIDTHPPDMTRWADGFLASQRFEWAQFVIWLFIVDTKESTHASLEVNRPKVLFLYTVKGRLGFRPDQETTLHFGQDRLFELYSPKKEYNILINNGLNVYYCFCLKAPFLEELSGDYPSLTPLLKSILNKSKDYLLLMTGKISPGIIGDFIKLKAGKKTDLSLQTAFSWLVLELIHQVKPNGNGKDLTAREKAFHAKILIDENVKHGPLPPTNEIAERYNMHSDTLNRAFKTTFGFSLKRYINQTKMEEAHRLLQEKKTIQEVSDHLGYNNRSSFSIQFTAHFGYPPGDTGSKPRQGPSNQDDQPLI
jgi:AraC-like DNA-binding protein